MYDFLLVHHCNYSSILYRLRVIWRCRDLEIGVRICSRSLELTPFDRSHTSSYSPSIVTMALYAAILVSSVSIATYWSQIPKFIYRTYTFSAPTGGDPVGISWSCLMLIKLEWLGYRTVKKVWPYYVKPFSSDTGTLRTDGRTDRQVCYINIARQYADTR